jgi:thioredoxin-related protein
MRLISILLVTLLLAPAARSAELVMFEQRGCVWCQKFDREIAPAYDKTSEGKRAPLRRQDIAMPVAAELAFINRERFTPVFVLIDEGREIGRIRGYPGDTFFWGLLANLIEKLDRGESAPPEPANTQPPPGATFAE